MSDPRFFKNSGPFSLKEINKFLGKETVDNEISNKISDKNKFFILNNLWLIMSNINYLILIDKLT